MAANGSPPPEFETDDEHSYFQVRLPVHPQAQAGTAKVGAGDTANMGEAGRDQAGTIKLAGA